MGYRATIPYGAYWSTPFAKWQGSFADLHSIRFAARVAAAELEKRDIAPEVFDFGVLGMTVPQRHSFYGLPWLMGLIGNRRVGGPTINQACASGVRCLLAAVQEIDAGLASTALVLGCDRTSNGPHLVYPNPRAPGATSDYEDCVLENFHCDPLGPHSMVQTAEKVARKYQLTTEEQHDVVLRRVEQYQNALSNNRLFQRRFITLPFPTPNWTFSKTDRAVDGDEGVIFSTSQGLAKLRPVLPNGTVTYGGQTHPADGSAAIIVTTEERSRELSRDKAISIRFLGFGSFRAELGHMPEAPVLAAKAALKQANMSIQNIDAIKSHNPFAVNDLVFARETGANLQAMNNYGCSLIWGHPQGPTGIRSIIELIEELVVRGGGFGLFHGCAAGDTALAVVIEVNSSTR
jgi:acetyl-CoA acetyltransferase family protein